MPTTHTYDVSTLGEAMLRIAVGPGISLDAADSATLHAAGAESNLACALASLGRKVAWASRLPNNALGRHVATTLCGAGVDLSHVMWCDSGRLGTFFVEHEPPPTPLRVTYDRADSCATQMTPESVDWSRLLNTRLLHLTGITPALSADCLATVQHAITQARSAGVPISFDINFRQKLWSADRAREVLLPLIRNVDLLFIATADAATVFNISEGTPQHRIETIRSRTGAKRVVMTIGNDGCVAWDGVQFLHQPALPTTVIDRLGAGDALAAGVIHGWLENPDDFAKSLQYGAALAALCLRRHGDAVSCSPAELQGLITQDDGRPKR